MARGTRSVRRGAIALAVVAALAVGGCSKSDDAAGPNATSTTTKGRPAATTTTGGPSKTTAPGGPTGTTTPSGPATPTTLAPGERPFAGSLDGRPDTAVTFVRGDGLRDFEAKGIEVTCNRTDNKGGPTTRTVDVKLPEVPVAADGSVDFTAEKAPYSPQLQGSFDARGRFLGGLYLSGQSDGEVCGAEVTFVVGG